MKNEVKPEEEGASVGGVVVVDEDDDNECVVERVSTVLMVAERLGLGNGLKVEISQVDLDFFGIGREESTLLTDATSESFSFALSSLFPLPTIHHTPDGLLWTSTDSIFLESMSPAGPTSSILSHMSMNNATYIRGSSWLP